MILFAVRTLTRNRRRRHISSRPRSCWVFVDRSQMWFTSLSASNSMPDSDFKRTYRVSRSTFQYLCEQLCPHVQRTTTVMRECIPAELLVAITIDRLANGHTFWTLRRLYNVSPAACKNAFDSVVHFIEQILAPIWICFPTDPMKLASLAATFMVRAGLPNCVGAVDGTHIKVKRPDADSLAYRNRKQYDSIVMQAIFASDCSILDIIVGWPGSVSDSRVWNTSPISQAFRNGSFHFPSMDVLLGNVRVPFYIIGDGGYANRPHLISPIKEDHALSPEEITFNFKHSSTRMPAEMGFGHLKGSWKYFTSCIEDTIQNRVKVRV